MITSHFALAHPARRGSSFKSNDNKKKTTKKGVGWGWGCSHYQCAASCWCFLIVYSVWVQYNVVGILGLPALIRTAG